MFAGPAAPPDRLVRVSTALVWAAGVAVLAGAAAVLAGGRTGAGIGLLVVGLILVALCFVYRRLAPVAYRLDDDGLEIERHSARAQRFEGHSALVPGARLGIRTFGSGGLYGYLGSFRLAGGATGPVKAFVTDRGRTVVVEVDGRRVAISPADRDGLVEELGGSDG